MDRFERRRLRLLELLSRDEYARRGGKSALAAASGMDLSYLSRLTLPEGSPNKKRIADEAIEKLAHGAGLSREWFDAEPGSALLPSSNSAKVDDNVESASPARIGLQELDAAVEAVVVSHGWTLSEYLTASRRKTRGTAGWESADSPEIPTHRGQKKAGM